ncbi:uncharacterized protein KY384_004156 [Bacidia gigantensis]|uniref:uncharacterized protein n=1 Tax=Bacidia gigantensis TaxID=2732470 RepID=UPI001D041460|nr:uncharacterized protein KY384_004156 [Bacidia gigantensis]KAG8530799.1 hypothetical protein KY384_004156 [Bacidia gigantensis]
MPPTIDGLLGPAGTSSEPSPFRRAIDAYIKSRPKKSTTPQFLLALQESGSTTTKDDVQRAMTELERKNANSTATRLIRKTLKPVMSVLHTYTGVIDTLAQADPMPTALVWGLVKAVVETSNRFIELYEKISTQLEAMRNHLARLTDYDDLYGDSVEMQEILEASELGQIVQARLHRREHEDQTEERRLAGFARDEHKAFFQEHLEELRLRNLERRKNRLKDFRDWLKADSSPVLETISLNSRDLQDVIKMLVKRLSYIYIFVDGLDEECDDGQRSTRMLEVVAFLLELTDENPHYVRIWCSSQDRIGLNAKLGHFNIIDVSSKLNNNDIQQFLADKMETFEHLEIEKGYRTLLSLDLCQKAEGCFLWASLMLDSISKAPTLYAIQELIERGLPQGYEVYYKRRLEDLDVSQRAFVSILLACVLYAKRPLRLEELCESMAVFKTSDGENINKSQKLFRNQVLKLCEPLVEIQESDNYSICTLSHASVRKFLIEYFKNDKKSAVSSVSHDPMGYICLRYLSQPCYRRLLVRSGETFTDMNDEDITEHHLLSYAAKYWDKHLDDLPYSQELCGKVEQFLNSSQFQTCLQTQSLFVEGQFQVWYNSVSLWRGPQRRRVFPTWLSERCGHSMEQQYQFFVAQWGNVLNSVTSMYGDHPGEIDRCFWNALGTQNFLHDSQSRYKNFAFTPEIQRDQQIPIRYFEGINEIGNRVVVVTLMASKDDPSDLQFWCDEWALNGRSPSHVRSQLLDAKRSSWRLYDQPKTQSGWPVPVSLTSDLQSLRIGNHIFVRSSDQSFVSLESLIGQEDYFEEVISCGGYVALSTRGIPTQTDLFDKKDDKKEVNKDTIFDHSEELAQILEESVKSADSIANSTATTSTQETENAETSLNSTSSSNTSVSSLVIEEPEAIDYPGKDIDLQNFDAETLEDDLESDRESNSANESWSEGSTNDVPDELDDEDQWNDWRAGDLVDLEDLEDLEEEILQRDDDNSDSSNEPDAEEEPATSEDSYDSEDIEDAHISLPMGYRLKQAHSSSSNSTTSSIGSTYSQSIAADSDDPDADDSDFENENGRRLEDLMLGRDKASKSPSTKHATLRVYSLEHNNWNLVFHYSESSTHRLYGSPPVIHPTQPLLVWPLGNNEVLFANLIRNTYFTRRLCCSEPKSCHVFIKTHFSADGRHLHFAALEASGADGTDDEGTKNKQRSLHLNLQVTTHRLSGRKTARAPPSLVFRTNVSLGSTTSLSVSRLPYTLTWTPKHLYLTSNSETLAITRIPLSYPEDGSKRTPICSTQGEVFLPRSVESRNVYYFPPAPTSSTPSSKGLSLDDNRQRQRKKDKATIIIGSYSSEPSQRLYVPKNLMSPPIGLYLDEEKHLGGWECKTNVEGGGRVVNLDGGKLKGKFESFDLNEDCDIVPYLV